MKYCLSVGLHNLFFDLAIVDNHHTIIGKHKCNYDRSKDIAANIYNAYKKYFSNYKLNFLGVAVSNNIPFKEDILYRVYRFNFNRYNLKQSLEKLFKIEVYINEETYLASLASSYDVEGSLLYVLIDKKISNSFVVDNELIELEEDIDLRKNENLNSLCSKDVMKTKFLANNYDDDFIGTYFLSNDSKCKDLVKEWANNLDKYLLDIIKELPVNNIVFAGYIGAYYKYYKEYMKIDKNVNCSYVLNHRELALLGVSHLIFKDN